MSAISTDALLLIDKPAGVTSHDIVARARRALGMRKIGHAGTLDPFATGLLLLLTGKGTRLLQYVPTEPKVYEATIRFGFATDTDDLTGAPTRTAPPPDPSLIPAAIERLTGELEQRPPSFSAKHVNGRRAYDVARRGTIPELRPTRVTVHAWTVLGFRGDDLDVRISCGTGTYIRALARDLGEATGSAAHLVALRRTQAGPFHVEDADSYEALSAGEARQRSLLASLPNFPQQLLTDEEVPRVARGMRVRCSETSHERALLVTHEGALAAIAHRMDECWQPDAVLLDA